jgi:hypothetical protein
MAKALAAAVMDKPKPPLWMIFVPVFFVFFAQRMKQYKSGFADFVENYLLMRSRALDSCLEFSATEENARMEKLLNFVIEHIPQQARAPFLHWMHILTEHYQILLQAHGRDMQAMIRYGYRSKTDYLLFCNTLNKAEDEYSMALLPRLEGTPEDLLLIIQKMNDCVTDLRRKEADRIFG